MRVTIFSTGRKFCPVSIFYAVTRSYSSRAFLCTLVRADNICPRNESWSSHRTVPMHPWTVSVMLIVQEIREMLTQNVNYYSQALPTKLSWFTTDHSWYSTWPVSKTTSPPVIVCHKKLEVNQLHTFQVSCCFFAHSPAMNSCSCAWGWLATLRDSCGSPCWHLASCGRSCWPLCLYSNR